MNFECHLKELDPADAQAFREVARRLRAQPDREPSADLTVRIMAAVDGERTRQRKRGSAGFPYWITAAAAAAVFFLSAGLFTEFRSRGELSGINECVWLAANQEADGTWDPVRHGGLACYRPALTALSALALDRTSANYGSQVRRACEALVAMQGTDGAFGGSERARLYNHAITLFALATLYPKHPALKPTLDRALAFAQSRQTVEGGWDYLPGSEGNAAVTAWLVRALSCAEAQGFVAANVPLRKGLRWLRGTARDDGSIAYHPGASGRSDALTALAAYALITAGKDFAGLPELGRLATKSLKRENGPELADCYRDYAEVIALDSAGASAQADTVRRQMARHQRNARPDQWGTVGGQLYTKALTALAAK